MEQRTAEINRKTKETDIRLKLNLNGNGVAKIDTGIGFLNHMLELFTVHSNFDMEVYCNGDVDVDFHHSVEDIGIALGAAINQALGDKKGIERYADRTIPMDESVVMCALDLSGRCSFVSDVKLEGKIGDFDCELIKEFFNAVIINAKINLFFKEFCGENKHHKAEAMFKAFAHCMKDACAVTGDKIPSSKGVL